MINSGSGGSILDTCTSISNKNNNSPQIMGSLGSNTSIKHLLSDIDFSSGSNTDDHQTSYSKLTAPLPPPSSSSSSPPHDSVSESNKKSPPTPSSDFEQLASTKFSALKFDADGDVAFQSPDRSLWEFFTDQLDGDFMICSPVRIVGAPSPPFPQSSNSNYSQQTLVMAAAAARFSPPRMSTWPLAPSPSATSSNKGKGISPLHKVFNSPNNQTYMQVETLTLPALRFLDDVDNDDDDDTFPLQLQLNCNDTAATSSNCFDLSSVPELLDSCPSQLGSQLVQDENHDLNYHLSSNEPVPLIQQLQQERQQEQTQSLGSSLMVPIYSSVPEQEQDSGLRLVHLLLACAEAVAKEDYMLARRYIHHLNRVVTPLGDSMQRVASCFAEALEARLTATLTAKAGTSSVKSFDPFPHNSLEILKIYQILYQACPYVKFAHFTANQAIFEAFEGEERVHVIDLDILQGYQWPAFMQALAARPGGAPFLRITGIGPSPERVRETGRCLSELAHSLHIPFEYHPVGEQLEDLKPHMFNRRVGEALAVNSVNRLHRVPANSIGNLLGMIRDQAPNIVTIVEQEASHNGPYFLGRFLEALHYYSAIFDSLDATFPADSSQRAKVEQYIFAPEIRNIVACEGLERVMRHERLEKWRRMMEGKGFKGVPLSPNAVTQSKILLGLYSCDGYRLTEDKGCLLLGWQDRAILAASAWQC